MAQRRAHVRKEHAEADVSFWSETLVGIEVLLLKAAPVYYGLGTQKGDGAAVVLIPGFLANDVYLVEMYAWLKRLGYRPYYSGIGWNAQCPNLLMRQHLDATMDRAQKETGKRIHLIGHSLGGIMARAAASQRPKEVASVITMGSPFRGTVVHPQVLRAAEMVRERILHKHSGTVLPSCYTARCTCNFLYSLKRDLPDAVFQTAIYTRTDGIVDWKYCVTGNPEFDFEVPGSHLGLAFNPTVYHLIAERLAEAREKVPSRVRDLPRGVRAGKLLPIVRH
jgi:pimeloyl-ACP methyl ester carboxylesterase